MSNINLIAKNKIKASIAQKMYGHKVHYPTKRLQNLHGAVDAVECNGKPVKVTLRNVRLA